MKKAIFITCLIGLFSLELSAQKIKWLDGTWTGTGYQPNAFSQDVWDIQMQYAVKSGIITITYPSLSCGGKWIFQSGQKNRATFIEKLDYGFTQCGNNGMLVVSYIDQNYVTIAYYDPFDKTSVIAIGILKKDKTN